MLTHDDHVKVFAALTVVSSHLSCKMIAPEDALDVVGTGRITATALAAWVESWATFKV